MRSVVLAMCLFTVCEVAHAQYQRFVWIQIETNTDQWALMDNTRPPGQRQLGIFESSKGEYFPLKGDEWLAPEDPPSGADFPPGYVRKQKLPTGVVANKIPAGDHVYHNGEEITKEQALALLAGQKALESKKASESIQGDSKIPDDSKKVRVSVIGSTQSCAKPVELAKKHSEFAVMDYRPTAWMIQRQGFAIQADPTIYIQEPDGKVIRRLDGWEGDVKFEVVLQEVAGRKIGPVPNYDKEQDEGWYHKNILPILNAQVPWIPVAVVGGLLVYALWSRRKKISI